MNFFREKYKSLKRRWFSKTPKEKYFFCHKIGDFTLRLVGINLFGNNEIYFWTYSSGVLLAIYTVLAVYTIVISNIESHFKECLECLCISGVMVAVQTEIL